MKIKNDLHNICNDRAAEARILSTTDELYISSPYFTPAEATLIKATVISPPLLNEVPESEDLEVDGDPTDDRVKEPETMTIEEAIKSRLRTFFEKRRASGDVRPCGPHDLQGSIRNYERDLEDEKFLSRLRRAGLGHTVRSSGLGTEQPRSSK